MNGEKTRLPASQSLNEVSRSNKSKDNSGESCLARAIKEHENGIVQSILSPATSSTIITYSSDGVKASVTKGLEPLLDYLFEDGQLTRAEYDFVDKAHGIQSAQEQVQVLLRILVETKDDEALQVLLQYLKKLDPSSDTINKLCASFPGSENKTDICTIDPKTFQNRKDILLYLSLSLSRENNTRKRQDFYYGRNPRKLFEEENDHGECFDGKELLFHGDKRHQMNKTTPPTKEITDFRDFKLTNGCLESIRNLILDSKESLTALGWERVLRNMNGLLSTDVLSIKDRLFQIKCFDDQSDFEEEKLLNEQMRRMARERLQQLRSDVLTNLDSQTDDDDINTDENITQRSERKDDIVRVKWDQTIYHSLQVWKQRNIPNSTFYSLIGVLQHSGLHRTADFILANKMEVQARESEKDVELNKDVDLVQGRASISRSSSTMLEKSDFLRKFYSPSRRKSSAGNSFPTISSPNSSLSTTKDRVCVSPVLSLDLL